MATAQLFHSTETYKATKEKALFPSQITTEHESLVLVKKLLATSVSCITYLRGLFPESSYGTRCLDDLSLKILREDKKCPGSLQIIKWIQGCFDALEKKYLHMAVLAIYTNPKEPEKVTELYQFKFQYTKEGPKMDFVSSTTSFESGTTSEEIKKASILLIRKLYLLMQNLGPLPNDITLTMKLFYYNEVTPNEYQPPGFKEGESAQTFLFEGNPVSLKLGFVSTHFHNVKVKIMTESQRMMNLGSNILQENSITEISHQGLDCDEEDDEGSVSQLLTKMPAVSLGDRKRAPLPSFSDSSTSSKGIQRLQFMDSQQNSAVPKKKRKVSEPVSILIPDRK
ncbi:HORMA domain-containing protein 2 isoform X2 [Monodelphis domestica]|uniref:HORMA domain-containing protein 2 isoform X2 n=1 Tax=Monodelphis domestica TaxID=13616 RepID=UPI0024E23DAF|nr:HORMA domain-containing protein 2 isoform X2 [Monodelphis domestica]